MWMHRQTSKTQLTQFIEEESDMLRRTLRFYILRAGLAVGTSADAAADELLNETVVEALQHAGRFRLNDQPKVWLLGIAANLIKRKQVDLAKRNRREPLVRDLYAAETELSDDELFDRLAAFATDTDGSERFTIRVRDIASGTDQGDSIPDGDHLRVANVNFPTDVFTDRLTMILGVSGTGKSTLMKLAIIEYARLMTVRGNMQ